MALPSSGQLSLSQIATELGLSTSNISLRTLSSTAGLGTPDKISEFYGYSRGGGGGGGSTYSAVMYGVFLRDTCSGDIINIYTNDRTGDYYYSRDERTYTQIIKPIYVYSPGWQDYNTGEWYWDEFMVYQYGFEMTGAYYSYCGPF